MKTLWKYNECDRERDSVTCIFYTTVDESDIVVKLIKRLSTTMYVDSRGTTEDTGLK